MKRYPPIATPDDAPKSMFGGGHLWIQEKVDGAHLRFQLRESGLLRFGDRNRVHDADAVPTPYQHAVRHIRENFDRSALRSAVENVESVVFFGEAMHRHIIDYEWSRTPSFLGFDIWSDSSERFLSPDRVEAIYRRLGLNHVNAFEKEVRAVDFDPHDYEIPRSNWYDGPAKGVVLRNKTGDRAKLLDSDFDTDTGFAGRNGPKTSNKSPEAVARAYATDRRFERTASTLEANQQAVTVDALFERTFETIVREEHAHLFDETNDIDLQAFRSELASLAQRFVSNRR
ncbi:RNA ligase family protein [Haladaptatus pallidirubidus]|uniref:RNA ligase domain-containing protein n=1 Tax=Haladaptatus pallidirubidus TaxID=1008152 RepID=A0AAV3UNF2_9EURY|nr:RNA ligase family protein [Haladaptatus pallidirubidus]